MENLKAKDQMDIESFIEAAWHSFYHGSDLSVCVLSRMLKIPIAAWNSHFLWVSTPYISIYDCPVLVVMDSVGNFHGTGINALHCVYVCNKCYLVFVLQCSQNFLKCFRAIGSKLGETNAIPGQGFLQHEWWKGCCSCCSAQAGGPTYS